MKEKGIIPIAMSGVEMVLSPPDAACAVEYASEDSIAVLGVEQFRPLPDGMLQVLDLSDYDKGTLSQWSTIVEFHNLAAREWIKERMQVGTGFILTTASEPEWNEVAKEAERIKKSDPWWWRFIR